MQSRIVFRGDSRPPEKIFKSGFHSREAGAIKYNGDIDSKTAVCVSTRLSAAAIFPIPNKEGFHEETWIYIVKINIDNSVNKDEIFQSKLTKKNISFRLKRPTYFSKIQNGTISLCSFTEEDVICHVKFFDGEVIEAPFSKKSFTDEQWLNLTNAISENDIHKVSTEIRKIMTEIIFESKNSSKASFTNTHGRQFLDIMHNKKNDNLSLLCGDEIAVKKIEKEMIIGAIKCKRKFKGNYWENGGTYTLQSNLQMQNGEDLEKFITGEEIQKVVEFVSEELSLQERGHIFPLASIESGYKKNDEHKNIQRTKTTSTLPGEKKIHQNQSTKQFSQSTASSYAHINLNAKSCSEERDMLESLLSGDDSDEEEVMIPSTKNNEDMLESLSSEYDSDGEEVTIPSTKDGDMLESLLSKDDSDEEEVMIPSTKNEDMLDSLLSEYDSDGEEGPISSKKDRDMLDSLLSRNDSDGEEATTLNAEVIMPNWTKGIAKQENKTAHGVTCGSNVMN